MNRDSSAIMRPIGIFDSGIGGLSVLNSLKKSLPHESYVYLGDTARLPYGTKSKNTVVQYALQAAKSLLQYDIKLLVIACNTATALALPELQTLLSIPVIGVVEPSVQLALKITQNKQVALIATEATVASRAYERVLHHYLPQAKLTAKGCALLVALAEEGLLKHTITESVVRYYLDPFFSLDHQPDCLILGCTHFVFLREVIEKVVDGRMQVIDSADTTAAAVKHYLSAQQLSVVDTTETPQTLYLVTDHSERFMRLANLFSEEGIPPSAIQHIDIINI